MKKALVVNLFHASEKSLPACQESFSLVKKSSCSGQQLYASLLLLYIVYMQDAKLKLRNEIYGIQKNNESHHTI